MVSTHSRCFKTVPTTNDFVRNKIFHTFWLKKAPYLELLSDYIPTQSDQVFHPGPAEPGYICPTFANSVDPDQSASEKPADLDLHCLSFTI